MSPPCSDRVPLTMLGFPRVKLLGAARRRFVAPRTWQAESRGATRCPASLCSAGNGLVRCKRRAGDAGRLPTKVQNACGVRILEPDPEKWTPVFPRDKREAFARRSCSDKKIERDDDSKKCHRALEGAEMAGLGVDFDQRLSNGRSRQGSEHIRPPFAVILETERCCGSWSPKEIPPMAAAAGPSLRAQRPQKVMPKCCARSHRMRRSISLRRRMRAQLWSRRSTRMTELQLRDRR